jgi:hypothetical protein
MPRPKRTKVASNASKAPSAEATDKKSNRSKPSDPLKVNKGISGRMTRQTAENRESSAPEEFRMSGALPLPNSVQETASNEISTSVNNQLQNESNRPQSRTKRLRPSHQKETKSSSPVRNPTTRIRAQTPDLDNSTDSDLYGLSPSGEISRTKLESQQASRRASLMQPQSAIKALSTPSVETSILALNKFKRRTRQPSIIRQMLEASELGNVDDFTLDDFNPENESTPLQLNREVATHNGSEPRTSSSRKRKHSEMIQSSMSTPLLSSPPPSSPIAQNDVPEEHNLPHIEDTVDAELLSDIMAPPMSSSSENSPPHHTYATTFSKNPKPVGDNTKRRRRVTKVSTDVLQSFLPKARARRSRRQQTKRQELDSSQPISAPNSDDLVDLTSDTSVLAAEEPKPKKPLNRPPASTKTKPHQSRPTTTNQPRRKALAENNNTQLTTPAPPKGSNTSMKSKQRRTYGKRAMEEDKENENDNSYAPNSNNDVDESTLYEEASKSKELVKLKNKFAEIDAWEMEYENVDLGGSSSSPWR